MYSQIKLKRINNSETKVFVNQHNFYAGIINSNSRVFYHTARSSKNVFNLFGGGLGINEDILLRKDFDKIVVKFNNETLTTTRLKWLKKGIASPYCNAEVDKQIILQLDKITLDDAVDIEKELNLFGNVS